MSQHLPVLILLATLVPAVSLPLIALKNRALCRPIALGSVALMGVLACLTLAHVLSHGDIHYAFGGWAAPIGVAWVADGVASVMVAVLSVVVLLTLVAGRTFLQEDGPWVAPYYTLLLLIVSGATGILLAADLFNVFVFLEVTALCAYALVASSGGRALMSAFRYLMLGSLGATLYLLAVGFLYAMTGTLGMADLSERLPALLESKAVLAGLGFLFIGLGIKAALVPFHGWLPDAYADADEAVSPILSSVVTKVALFAWIRIMFWVLGAGSEVQAAHILDVLWILGAVASITGAFLALNQQRIKRMFAYGGLAHVGLILVAAGQANQTGVVASLFYLGADTFMQAALFVWAGAALHHYGAGEVHELGKLRGRAPFMIAALVVIAMSVIGFPPTAGFFGKWYILLSTLEGGNYIATGAIVLSTLLTMAYFVRILQGIFQSTPGEDRSPAAPLPLSLRIGLGGLVLGILALGLMSDPIIHLLTSMTESLNL